MGTQGIWGCPRRQDDIGKKSVEAMPYLGSTSKIPFHPHPKAHHCWNDLLSKTLAHQKCQFPKGADPQISESPNLKGNAVLIFFFNAIAQIAPRRGLENVCVLWPDTKLKGQL